MTSIVDADRFRTRSSARGTGGRRQYHDVLRRLGIVESLGAKTREDVSAIKGAFGHLVTKADLNDLKANVNAIGSRRLS